ncbi:MFS transporter, FSR family, fosmidomycin resistance protein [Dyadobacter sp. SG02]|uniref:MFS transporter n=1 Tax=Dyadobacter sp. SG02 TaxID=1855291 RepID=UPI0008AACAFE|nr:MFS transporter [Dyadobacter sp. SG02]SEI53099.1 MFS transporter, FSR family, fosmidomycin resistance protein [Dyadobacter sp. SG02]
MMNSVTAQQTPEPVLQPQRTVYPILFAISFAHLLNDTMQAVIASIYPMLKVEFHLSFAQIGLVTLCYQITASLLQPFVGLYTDKNPKPFSIAVGMGFSLIGLMSLAWADSFGLVLIAVSLIGVGSSIFHPESSRIAHLSSGGKRGFAQSFFQLGGNSGSALGPLLAALVVAPFGQHGIMWFSLAALLGGALAIHIGKWYRGSILPKSVKAASGTHLALGQKKVVFSLVILLILIFSKYVYLAGMTSYYTFFLMNKFGLTIQESQIRLFIFSAAVAIGTVAGGPIGDRFGRKYVIWASILGAAPFTMLLPYANLFWTTMLSVCIGLIISSAFSAIVVYAQELVPGKVGLIGGLFFGLSFGMGGLGSALLGNLADKTSIGYVFQICAFLPLIGIITGLLPKLKTGN